MAGKTRNEASSSTTGSGGRNRGESVVIDVGRRKSSCGYCRSGSRTSISHGLWAHSITVDDYQDLLDRGWRRSGSFLYKPEMEKTCCPSYTIRLRVDDFVPSKEQLRASKRMQRFLDGTLNAKKQEKINDGPKASKSSGSCIHHDVSGSAAKGSLAGKDEEKNEVEAFMHYLSDQIDDAVRACIEKGEFVCDVQLPKASVKMVLPAKRKLQVEGSEDLLYSSNISFQIAATLRRVQSAEKDVPHSKLSRHNMEKDVPSLAYLPKTIAEKLASSLNHMVKISGISVRACNGHINFYSSRENNFLSDRIQIVNVPKESSTGSGTEEGCLKKNSECPQAKRRKLEIRLKRSSFDPEEFALYRKYQIKVHNDTPEHVMESSYRRFLVDTPLEFVPPTGDDTVPPCGFGSFHQQYVVDGKLVAVGVIDILPRCLSSKYLFWDPDLAFLSLGKYSALQEIGWVKENQAHCPSLQYYYLGYYIHSCSKMRYKAAYHPSELLCPLRYQWIPFDIARPLLDGQPYVVLSDFAILQKGGSTPHVPEILTEMKHDSLDEEDSNDIDDAEMDDADFVNSDDESDSEANGLTSVEIGDGDVSNILIGLKHACVRFKDLQHAFGPRERSFLETQLHGYVRAVGAEIAGRMVYSLGGD